MQVHTATDMLYPTLTFGRKLLARRNYMLYLLSNGLCVVTTN